MHTTLTAILRTVALAGLCTLSAACGGSATSAPPTAVPAPAAPTVNVPEPTLAPAPTAVAVPTQATSVPTAQAVPIAQVAQTAQASQAGQPTAPPAAAASVADNVRLEVDSSASTASYHAQEQLAGNDVFTPAVGTTPGVSGALVIGDDGSIDADQSTITVDLSMLKSDESRRDNYIKNSTLQTSQFPTATFVARQQQGLTLPLPTSGQATFQLLGDLTVHGVTQPATWQVTAQFAETGVTGSATTTVKLTDFGMTPPKVGPVLSIKDNLDLDLAFTVNRGA